MAAEQDRNTTAPSGETPRAPHRMTLAEQELVGSLGWLISLRWLAGLAVIQGTLIATTALQVRLPAGPLYAIGAAILAYNAVLAWAHPLVARMCRESTAACEWFTRAMIGLDWAAMAALINLSGGVESPAIIFFLFHITIASLLLPHSHGFLYVTLAPVLVGGVALLEYTGILPHVAIVEPARYRDPLYVGSVIAVFAASCYVMAYFCMRIARRLRRRENELSGLYESMRDLTSTLELQAVLNRFVEGAARVLGCKAAAMRLLDSSRSQVEFAATWGLSDQYVDDVPADLALAPLDRETIRGEPIFVNDVMSDPQAARPDRAAAEGIRSMLSVPLVGRHGPVGVLRAYGSREYQFAREDAAFLGALAAQGVVAIENARAYRALADVNRDKSRFIRVTTHELRSPVTVTESLLTALADGYAGPLDASQADLVKRAIKRLGFLHTLVDDLLDLAAGKSDLTAHDRRVVSLTKVLSEVVEHFQPVARSKGVRLDLKRPDDPLDVWSDPADLDRIFTNLIGNALKYTEVGEVRVAAAVVRDDVRVRVADTGIGIPSDAMPYIFQEFFRATNAKMIEESGTGLGLPIVKDLVDRYKGRIEVDSSEGKGTTIAVFLPLAFEPVAAAAIV